jgi:hypothetical protein
LHETDEEEEEKKWRIMSVLNMRLILIDELIAEIHVI